jgi:hypothetical protein
MMIALAAAYTVALPYLFWQWRRNAERYHEALARSQRT